MSLIAVALLSLATAGQARMPAVPIHTIEVMGAGEAWTPPNRAIIDYWIAGEGKTPDEASRMLADKHQGVIQGLSGLLGAETRITTGNIMILETRAPECNGPNSYNAQPHLSQGACAVTGYIATLQGNVRTGEVAKAGTAVGLAARLGARDVRLESFVLDDSTEAQRRATGQALADARQRAAAIASGAGARLGPVVTIRDQNFRPNGNVVNDLGVLPAAAPAPPAPPPPPPIAIDVSPRPIETRAQVYVTYQIFP